MFHRSAEDHVQPNFGNTLFSNCTKSAAGKEVTFGTVIGEESAVVICGEQNVE
jgi:hypothetical protein